MRRVKARIMTLGASLAAYAGAPPGARAAETITAAPPAAPARPDVWQADATFQNSFGTERLERYRRNMVIDAAKAKLALRVEPAAFVRFGISALVKDYYGTTTIPADSYLPDDARAALVDADPAAGRPGTADLLAFPLSRQQQLHEAYAALNNERVRLTVGRQLFLTGTGQAFRPTDLFNFTHPGDPMWEPEGHDGVHVALGLSASTRLEGFVERQPSLGRANWIGRASASVGIWRGGLSFTHHAQPRTDWEAINSVDGLAAVAAGNATAFVRDFRWDLAAAEVVGALAGVNLRAEAGYAFVHAPAEVGTLARAADSHLRLLLGADHAFAAGFSLLLEYMYLGQGRVRSADLDLNDRLGQFTGELVSASRHTIFFAAGQELGSRFGLGLRGMAMVMDPVNVVFMPYLSWRMSAHATLDLNGTLPTGSPRGVIGDAGPGALVWLKLETGLIGAGDPGNKS